MVNVDDGKKKATKEEKGLVQAGLKDPAVRGIVLLSGIIDELPTKAARVTVLQYAVDRLQDLTTPSENRVE